MKLVVLGSGTSVPHPRRAAAGFWLDTDSGSILLDCGADASHRMAVENLDWPNLDAIWISHLHLDHCGGLAPFLSGIKHAPQTHSRKKPLKIWSCAGGEKLLRAIDESHNYKLFELPFPIELEEISAAQVATPFEILSALDATVLKTPHRPESLAIRITDRTGTAIVYTADTGFTEAIVDFARGADLLILECSFFQDKPVGTHLELTEAMQIARLAEPRRLLLTHLYPQWDGVDLAAEAKKLWAGETIAAYDGLRLEL
jgi:ribonuclease BN (tRNA processing enzyme)